MAELVASDRWWVVSDRSIVSALLEVESGRVSAAEMYALMLEHSEVHDDDDDVIVDDAEDEDS